LRGLIDKIILRPDPDALNGHVMYAASPSH